MQKILGFSGVEEGDPECSGQSYEMKSLQTFSPLIIQHNPYKDYSKVDKDSLSTGNIYWHSGTNCLYSMYLCIL